MQMPDRMGRVMVGLGLLAEITVTGRSSGQPRTALVNKAAAPGGGYYVAAGDDTHQWAKNLRVSGRCLLRVKRRAAEYVATELLGDDYAAAVKALAPPIGGSRNAITGPAFRLDELE